MGDNVLAARCESQLQNHVIVRVRKKGPPEEMDGLWVGVRGKKSQKAQSHFGGCSRRQVFRPGEDFLPFEVKCDRKREIKVRMGDQRNEAETGTQPRMNG